MRGDAISFTRASSASRSGSKLGGSEEWEWVGNRPPSSSRKTADPAEMDREIAKNFFAFGGGRNDAAAARQRTAPGGAAPANPFSALNASAEVRRDSAAGGANEGAHAIGIDRVLDPAVVFEGRAHDRAVGRSRHFADRLGAGAAADQ